MSLVLKLVASAYNVWSHLSLWPYVGWGGVEWKVAVEQLPSTLFLSKGQGVKGNFGLFFVPVGLFFGNYSIQF